MAASRFDLTGKTALVTGASSGLGQHFARVLSRAGAGIVLAARRVDRLAALAAEITAGGGRATAVACDVTSTASVAAAFTAGAASLGPISIVINNAGVPSAAWFAKTSDEEWASVLDVNLTGVFRVGREAARHIQANAKAGHATGGSIINIASILGFGVLKTLSTYATSKAAVVQLTKAMALELARDRIRVNALAPGYFETEINDGFLDSDEGKSLLAKVPMKRHGDLAELDGPLLLLASDAGAYMTGSIITVDGGTLLSMG